MHKQFVNTFIGSLLAVAPFGLFGDGVTPSLTANAVRPTMTSESFIVHEWGTFTSLQGSNGAIMEGLNHEEEALPDFVHSLDVTATAPIPNPPGSTCHFVKGMRFCDGHFMDQNRDPVSLTVTQKMETPVLYFYSKEPRSVKLDISFPSGLISQYYPAPATVIPQYVTDTANGKVSYDFNVLGEGASVEIPEVTEDSVYAPSRNVNSNFIQTSAHENEKLIFYRGLGNFTTSVSVTSSENGDVIVHNTSKSLTIPAGILLYSNGTSGAYIKFHTLAPGASSKISGRSITQLKEQISSNYVDRISADLVKMLEHSGLYHDEALAMTSTWKKSYFKTPGLRLLHILTQQETESILPLKMTPQPTELVRILVGRIEILTYQDEQQLIGEISRNSANFDVSKLGRTAEAKLRRIKDIVPTGFKSDIEALIEQAQQNL